METIEYKNLEWYIINETDKEKLLFLKDCFTNEQIMKYFLDESMVDEDYDVKFSKKNSPWFRDSYIREVLNTVFLSDLDVNDLNKMKTTVSLNRQNVTTRDYVRLITKEEVEKLSKEILKTEKQWGYWTLSPYCFRSGDAYVFFVNGSDIPDRLNYYRVYATYGVRPVISLKSKNVMSTETKERERINELVRSIRMRIDR